MGAKNDLPHSAEREQGMKTVFFVLFWTVSVGVLSSPMASAGHVTGTIVFEGKAPRMRPVQLDADPVCAKLHSTAVLTEWLVLGEGQTVSHMIVRVVSGVPQTEYPVPAEDLVFTQKGCVYSPHAFVIRVGQTMKILNPDGTTHNIHIMPKLNREFNKAMAKQRKEMTTVFHKEEDPFAIKCDAHAWMNAFCAVSAHPFHDVTGLNGTFSIEGLPAGNYELEAWHERLGAQRVKITVPVEGDVIQDFTFVRPTKKP